MSDRSGHRQHRARLMAGGFLVAGLIAMLLVFLAMQQLWPRGTRRVVLDAAATRAAAEDGLLRAARRPQPVQRDYVVRICDERGSPIADAQVWISPPADAFFLSEGPPPPPKSITTASGLATIKAWGNVCDLAVASSDFATLLIERAHLDSAQPLELRLTTGMNVRGNVVDPQGKALAGVKVSARRRISVPTYSEAFDVDGTTNASGAFELQHLGDGDYDLVSDIPGAQREALYTESQTLTVSSKKAPPPVKLAARVGSVLKAKVLEIGVPRRLGRQAQVYWRTPTTSAVAATADAEGRLVLRGIPAGVSGGLGVGSWENEQTCIVDPQNRSAFHLDGGELRFDALPLGTYDGLEVRVEKR